MHIIILRKDTINYYYDKGVQNNSDIIIAGAGLSGLMAAISGFLMVGWLGSVTNGIAMTYELKVIASTVIGGANLMGGAGGVIGAVIGAALIEIIRNGLLLAGMDPYWQGTFVGIFIILAVLIDKIKLTGKK